MNHQQLKICFWLLIALFIPMLVVFGIIDPALRVPAAPYGIVSFEFCGFSANCETTLSQWGVKGQQLAMLILGLDYLFLMIYPSLVCIGLLLLAPAVPVQLKKLTVFLAWLALGAAVADAIENYYLIRIILSGPTGFYGAMAGSLATLKFAILSITLAWFIFTALAYGRKKQS